MKRRDTGNTDISNRAIRGWAGWLIAKLRRSVRAEPRIRLVERIALAPRQSLALVEAEGRRFLVATSTDGAPAFCPLEESVLPADRWRRGGSVDRPRSKAARVSW
jgi:flagellar biogenesis protein FliO